MWKDSRSMESQQPPAHDHHEEEEEEEDDDASSCSSESELSVDDVAGGKKPAGSGSSTQQLDMELDQERMLALLRSFSTPIDPSNITSTRIESLPPSRLHSSSNIHSNLHSINNSSTSIPQHNCSTLSINFPHIANSLMSGSLLSCASGNMTPRPLKKYKYADSDAGTDLLNTCRICQLPNDDDDVLFSPCRCTGSLKYVHYSCLLKWIEISTRKTKRTPSCELCHFTYIRHKRFKFHDWRLPRVSRRDKCLHTVFLMTLIMMVISAVATVLCFLSDKGQVQHKPDKAKTQLSMEEVITLTCGILFFVSFFLAMTVEIKARHTVYRLFLKFVTHNTEWQIEPYDYHKDPACPKPYLYYSYNNV